MTAPDNGAQFASPADAIFDLVEQLVDCSVRMSRLEQAQAAHRFAEANLARTAIKAPIAGRITKLTAAKGDYAQIGQSLMMFVPLEVWVTANFKETQLADMMRSRSLPSASNSTSFGSPSISSPPRRDIRRRCARLPRISSRTASHADAQREAMGWLGMLVQSQATLLSFIDVLWVLAIFVAVLIPVALLLLRPVSQPGVPGIH